MAAEENYYKEGEKFKTWGGGGVGKLFSWKSFPRRGGHWQFKFQQKLHFIVCISLKDCGLVKTTYRYSRAAPRARTSYGPGPGTAWRPQYPSSWWASAARTRSKQANWWKGEINKPIRFVWAEQLNYSYFGSIASTYIFWTFVVGWMSLFDLNSTKESVPYNCFHHKTLPGDLVRPGVGVAG